MSLPRSSSLWNFSGAVAAAVLLACNDPASSTSAGSIRRVTGDSQTVVAGAALAAPMVVQVLAQSGDPLAGAVVSWTLATASTGTLAASTSTTDASGQTSMDFTAGTIAGSVDVGATVASVASVVFTHTVVGGVPSALNKFAGDGAAGVAGSGIQVVVKVTDSFNNAVSGVIVNWAVGASGGTLSAASGTSDATGLARVTLTLGSTPGTYTVSASSGSFTPVTFSVTAI
ncbi:MAG: Ig-like domain-containing protein [Gemmatimonadota bacterium]